MADHHSSKDRDCPKTQSGVRRRDLLLSGTALVAAAALGSGASTAQAQQTPPTPSSSSGSKPNILVIFSDKLCVTAPHGGYPHRHAMFPCEPRRCLIDWGSLLGNPVLYKRTR